MKWCWQNVRKGHSSSDNWGNMIVKYHCINAVKCFHVGLQCHRCTSYVIHLGIMASLRRKRDHPTVETAAGPFQ